MKWNKQDIKSNKKKSVNFVDKYAGKEKVA